MMFRAVLALLCVALSALAGCASETTVPWHWAGGPGQAAFPRDNYECTRDSQVPWGGSGWAAIEAKIRAEKQSQNLYNMCMESKGYVRECAPGSHWNDDRDKCKRPR